MGGDAGAAGDGRVAVAVAVVVAAAAVVLARVAVVVGVHGVVVVGAATGATSWTGRRFGRRVRGTLGRVGRTAGDGSESGEVLGGDIIIVRVGRSGHGRRGRRQVRRGGIVYRADSRIQRDGLGHDDDTSLLRGAVRHVGRAVGDGVDLGGVHGGGGHGRSGRRHGRRGRHVRLRLGDLADGRVQGDGLRHDDDLSPRGAVRHVGLTAGDGVDPGGVHGAGGQAWRGGRCI